MSYKIIPCEKVYKSNNMARPTVALYHIMEFSDASLLSELYRIYMTIYTDSVVNREIEQIAKIIDDPSIITTINDYSLVVSSNDPMLFVINEIARKYDSEIHLLRLLSENTKNVNPLSESECMFCPNISEYTDHRFRYLMINYILKYGVAPVVIVINDSSKPYNIAESMIHSLEKNRHKISYFVYDISTHTHIFAPILKDKLIDITNLVNNMR